MKLKNKIAIITGAARGIGYAIAYLFHEEGAKVIIVDATDASDRAQALGVDFIRADITKSADIAQIVSETIKRHGRIDVLVNNAGISIVKEFLEVTEEDYDQVMAVNIKGSFLLLQSVAKHMVEQGIKGTIVNMSSVNDTLAISTIAPYTISKGGVRQLTHVAAISLAKHGIRVNAIGPGSIMTDMLKGVMTDDASRKRILSRTPLGRVGEPSEIAKVAVFLASDDSSYVTGQVIYADGGRMPLNYTVDVAE